MKEDPKSRTIILPITEKDNFDFTLKLEELINEDGYEIISCGRRTAGATPEWWAVLRKEIIC